MTKLLALAKTLVAAVSVSLTAILLPPVLAQTSSAAGSTPLAKRGELAAGLQDHRAYFYAMPEDSYRATLRDPKQVKQVLDETLIAREFSKKPWPIADMNETERTFLGVSADRARILAATAIVEKRAKDAMSADQKTLDKRAREIYQTTDASSLKRDLAADFQHILFDVRARSFAETAQRISAAQKELSEGKSFDSVVATYSDQVNIGTTAGKFENVAAKSMDGILAKALFDELKPGEYSAPLPSRLGLHIVKLHAIRQPQKRPFEEIKDAMYARLIDEAGKSAAADFLNALQSPPTEFNDAEVTKLTGANSQLDPETVRSLMRDAAQKLKESTTDSKKPAAKQ
jgi:parvulin-like peptidyl-prolyl isomerase